jgi:hypothetical protein
MQDKSIVEIAESYGLTVKTVVIPGEERAFESIKVHQIFIGTEASMREFLADYEKSARLRMKAACTVIGNKGPSFENEKSCLFRQQVMNLNSPLRMIKGLLFS